MEHRCCIRSNACPKEQGLRVKAISPLKDIDTAEDLKQVLPGWAAKKPYVSSALGASYGKTDLKVPGPGKKQLL